MPGHCLLLRATTAVRQRVSRRLSRCSLRAAERPGEADQQEGAVAGAEQAGGEGGDQVAQLVGDEGVTPRQAFPGLTDFR